MIMVFEQPSLFPLRSLVFHPVDGLMPVPESGFVRGISSSLLDEHRFDTLKHMVVFGKNLVRSLECNRIDTQVDSDPLEGVMLGLAYPVDLLPAGSAPQMEIARVVSGIVESHLRGQGVPNLKRMSKGVEYEPLITALERSFNPLLSVSRDFRARTLQFSIEEGVRALFQGKSRFHPYEHTRSLDCALWTPRRESFL